MLAGLTGIVFAISLLKPIENYAVIHKVDFKQSIENAVQVQGLENKYIYVQKIGFGGAGAGGMGAPQVSISSSEQFLSLVPKEEQIYTTVRYQAYPNGTDNKTIVEKVYWAFIENRPGLMNYTEEYSYEGDPAENFDERSAYFKDYEIPWYRQGGFLLFLFIVSALLGIAGTNITE